MSVTTESVTTEEVHKQIVRRWVKEVFNEHKLDAAALELLVSPEGQLPTRDALGLLWLGSAFSDIGIAADELIAEDDQVMAILTFTGTHTGQLVDHPPTGKRVSVRQTLNLRVDDGRVVEAHYDLGIADLVEQVAAAPQPATSAKGEGDHASHTG